MGSRRARPRIAFVVQRYGLDVNGGAEQHCRAVAERLTRWVDVDVLTTCARDYSRWPNYYPPGVTQINGVTVHRFPTQPVGRDTHALLQRAGLLAHGLLAELEWNIEVGPFAPALFDAIARGRETYDAFIFFTYLYAPTVLGLHLAPERAILVPTAHDEPPIYLNLYRSVFFLPRVILYNTDAERDLVQRLFGNTDVPGLVTGVGIDPAPGDAARFRAKHGIAGDILLYVGRIDRHKGVDELLDFFERYQAQRRAPVTLVLVGRAIMPVPKRPDVVALGFLSDEEKADALAAATVFVMPSRFESLSMVTLEAWQAGAAVLANGACEVVKGLCLASNGGLFYETSEEFAVCLERLLRDAPLRAALGAQGCRYVAANYRWDVVDAKYLTALEHVGVDLDIAAAPLPPAESA
ncbi:MAG: glycosyltransferase family 4 protein [Anaerolineae bacterium]